MGYATNYSAAIEARFTELFTKYAAELDAAKTPADYWAVIGDYVKLECVTHAKTIVELSMDGVSQVADDYGIGPNSNSDDMFTEQDIMAFVEKYL